MHPPLHLFLYLFGLVVVVSAQTEEEVLRYERLRSEIARHDELYFRDGSPEITDAEYDRLKQEFAVITRSYPHLGKAAESAGIGDDRTGLFPTRRHAEPMLSLDKARTERDVRVFDDRLRARLGDDNVVYVVEPKYDGLALSLVYEKGRLVAAVTRGNGVEGDDVTENVRALLAVPEVLRGATVPGRVEIRGEAYVTFAQFEAINRVREAAGEPPFAHPRALAAGTLKLLDRSERGRRSLSFVVHGWGAWVPVDDVPGSTRDFESRLATWGLPMAENLGEATTADALWEILQTYGVRRGSWTFPNDGVVVKIGRTEARKRAGERASAPNWALAFKYAAEAVVTRVAAVTWQVGRTGVITPVAELEPVKVGGVTVSRATLHSPAHAARLDVRVGDQVEVERAGEVIPQILAVRNGIGEARGPSLAPPSHCPSCGTAVEEDRRAGHLRCPNYLCAAQIERRIEHYVSSSAVDIRGFGPVLVHTLVAQGTVRSPADLYQLTRDDLERAGAGGSAGALLAAVEASRFAERWRVIFGLGIPRIGATTSRLVADETGDLTDLIELGKNALADTSHGLSASARRELQEHFENADAAAVVRGLHAAGVGVGPGIPAEERSEVLKGQVVVFTGTLAGMTRTQAVSAVKAAGGRVASTVTSRTTLVVSGEGAGSKVEAAHRRGLPVVGEGEFRKLLEGAKPYANQR
jgi:DNA ligase (NAD+)